MRSAELVRRRYLAVNIGSLRPPSHSGRLDKKYLQNGTTSACDLCATYFATRKFSLYKLPEFHYLVALAFLLFRSLCSRNLHGWQASEIVVPPQVPDNRNPTRATAEEAVELPCTRIGGRDAMLHAFTSRKKRVYISPPIKQRTGVGKGEWLSLLYAIVPASMFYICDCTGIDVLHL